MQRNFGWFMATTVSRVGLRGEHGPHDRAGNEAAEERRSRAAGVMDDLEEAGIGGRLLPRDVPVRPSPGARQRPEAPGRLGVGLAETVAMVVGLPAAGATRGLAATAPGLQP